MFLQDNSSGGGPDSLKGAFQNAAQAYTQLQSAILEFDKAAKSVSADVFGQGAAAAAEMRKEIAEATSNMAGLGVSASDVASTMASIGTIMQRNVYLTNQQLESFIAIQKATNLTGEDMATLVEGFDAIGVGPTQAAEQIESARKRAASLGLNTGQFLKTVGDNVKLINSYNFRNGVEGFTNMVARSQALRINMADVTSLAGKLLDPSEAINLASEFQMLGGAVGALADPFQLMNMAQNDIDGLQESIVNAASAAVSFNSETGSFAISATEMRRLRAQASALNMDYEELANTAVKSAQRQEALSQLDLLGGAYTDEDKEFLANIGQFDGGELKFNLPGQDELKSATELTTTEIATLKETFRKSNLDSDDIAREQLTVLEQIEATLKEPAKRVVAGIAATEQFEELESRLKNTAGTISDTIGDALTPENVQKAFEVTDDVFKDAATIFSDAFTSYSERGVQGLGTSLANSFNQRLTNMSLPNVSLPNYNLPNVSLPNLPGGNNNNNNGSNSLAPNAIIPVNVAKVTNTDPMKVEVVRGTFDDLNVNHTGTIQLEGGGMSLQSLQTDPTALSNLTQMIQQEMARQGTSY